MPRALPWQSVAYGSGKFVAVAAVTDIVAYSTDGIKWTLSTMPISETWRSVTYGGGKFVAVAEDYDKAAFSEDGINWRSEGYAVVQGGVDCAEALVVAIGAATKEDVKKAVTVTSDVRLHLSVTADGILQVTVLDDEGG
jgi:hypothetical protein